MRHCRRRRRAARRPWRLPLTERIPVPLAPVRPRHDVEPRPRRSARPALESTGGLWHLPGRRPPCRRTPRIHRWIPASAVLSSGPRSRVIVGSDGSVRASPRLMREHCAQRRTGIGTRTTYATSARSYVQARGRTRAREVVRSPVRSYLRRTPRYDRAPPGTTAPPRYDRTPPGTTSEPVTRAGAAR